MLIFFSNMFVAYDISSGLNSFNLFICSNSGIIRSTWKPTISAMIASFNNYYSLLYFILALIPSCTQFYIPNKHVWHLTVVHKHKHMWGYRRIPYTIAVLLNILNRAKTLFAKFKRATSATWTLFAINYSSPTIYANSLSCGWQIFNVKTGHLKFNYLKNKLITDALIYFL